MDFHKRVLVLVTFFTCVAAVGLACLAMGTEYWVLSSAVRDIDSNATHWDNNVSSSTVSALDDDQAVAKYQGDIRLGLFAGNKILNYGIGSRSTRVWIKEEYDKNSGFLDVKMWISTIVFLSLAALLGVIAAIFAMVNTVMTPVETITGVPGLYFWNTCAGICYLLTISLYAAQFYTKFTHNVLSPEELRYFWRSDGRASLGYSFYVLIGSLGLHFVNCVLVFVALYEPGKSHRVKVQTATEKPADGIIMLY